MTCLLLHLCNLWNTILRVLWPSKTLSQSITYRLMVVIYNIVLYHVFTNDVQLWNIQDMILQRRGHKSVTARDVEHIRVSPILEELLRTSILSYPCSLYIPYSLFPSFLSLLPLSLLVVLVLTVTVTVTVMVTVTWYSRSLATEPSGSAGYTTPRNKEIWLLQHSSLLEGQSDNLSNCMLVNRASNRRNTVANKTVRMFSTCGKMHLYCMR
jgi:hypothetical protein